jgi:hypothetical protein
MSEIHTVRALIRKLADLGLSRWSLRAATDEDTGMAWAKDVIVHFRNCFTLFWGQRMTKTQHFDEY